MSESARDIIWLPATPVSAKDIIAAVAQKNGLTVEEMLAARRKKKLAHARQEAMWEIRQRTKLSLPQIAHRMRLKDHTTVLHGVRRHEERMRAGEVAE